jgi:toxin FitB
MLSQSDRNRGFVLDTNVVSEWIKPSPDPGVIQWTDSVDEDRVSLSVITIAELRHGVERISASRRRTRLETWLDVEVPARFGERLLPIDARVAHAWGRIVAACFRKGQPIGIMDGFLAATASVYELTLVTRNTADFVAAEVSTLNPWSGS